MAALDRLPPSVQQAVRPFLADDTPRVAVFDADGTLWRGDVGEDLLRYLAANGLLPRGASGAYARYEALHAVSPPEAYGYAVQVMAGMAEQELEDTCTSFFTRRFLGRVFPFVRPLFQVLRDARVAVWLCSASPRWIVEAGARGLGVDPANVIGVDAEVRQGVLTDELKLPVTAGPGKVTWLARRGVSYGFAAGNGELDRDMLEPAPHRLVVASFDGPDNALVRRAHAGGWPILRT
ncbi:MAG: haloacid dehalogenase-like hydrolase [Myxococcaceae bacterium]|nr:haloacid dehalogenase-like hydrolase [Myxococcaceae bacterium]